MNSRWDILPDSYWVQEVSIADEFARGGEAAIRKGRHHGEVVAIRQFPVPSDVLWSSHEGMAILKVRYTLSLCSECELTWEA